MTQAVNVSLWRDRAIVMIAITAITVVAWIYLLLLAGRMAAPTAADAAMASMSASGSMAGMDMAGEIGAAVQPAFRLWSGADFAFVFSMWAVMMVGMMTPSVAPMVLLYAAVGRNAAANGRPLVATGWFMAGYLFAWMAFSAVATGAQWMLTRLAVLTPMMDSASAIFGGLVLMAAGVYQWSTFKETCLRQCQTPLGFLMRRGGFRATPFATIRLGAEHGAYCVGCCWALMMLLFVGGVMNILWIAGLTILILVEKLVATGRLIPRIAGAVIATGGVFVLVRTF